MGTTRKVVVGLSGGVDSSVTALLLKQQGYEVIGLFMKNWHDDSVTISRECPWLDDSNDALIVAEKLGIPFQTVDLSAAYKERIVNYMFREYQQGRTPNPDVLCNREIKFDLFLKIAMDLGAEWKAVTGSPMGFGVFAARKDSPAAQLEEVAGVLREQLRGFTDDPNFRAAVLESTAERSGFSLERVSNYFDEVRFKVGEPEVEGLNRFLVEVCGMQDEIQWFG